MNNIIYRITNLINGKKYIGKTKNLTERWFEHQRIAFLRKKQHPLYDAIRKYGIGNFKIETIDSTKKYKDLDLLEQKHIQKENSLHINGSGYNLTAGGSGGDTWTNRSAESKKLTSQKLSIFMENRNKDPEFIKKLSHSISLAQSNPRTKKLHSKRTKETWKDPKIRARRIKALRISMKIPSEIVRRSEAASGKNNPLWLGYVYVYNSIGELYVRYESSQTAGQVLAMNPNTIRKNATNNEPVMRGPYKGFKFIITKEENYGIKK
jgi:group I intron endonuclease